VASAVVIAVVFLVALSGLWALRRSDAAAPEPPR